MLDLTPLLEAPLAVQVHVATVMPAAVIGPAQFLLPKGTAIHRTFGYAFMALMIATSISAFFIESFMGQRFSWIHLFIPLTLFGVIRAWFAIKRGDVFNHAIALVSVYFGALVVAGYFAFQNGRIMDRIFFG